MDKKMNAAIIIAIVIVAAAGLLVWNGSQNKTGAPAAGQAPAVDRHGHPVAANVDTALLNELLDKPAPDFALTDKDGKTYSSNELRGKDVILFFNEGLMCYPACWNQIVALAKDERLKNTDTVVLSVVVDPLVEWQKAIKQMPELAEATVVFDKDAMVSKQFGMLTTASSMHYGSLPGHTFVLIDKKGVIKHVFDDPNMSIHNDQLVAELSKLNQN
ncbi:MAG: redoxin domain-containing protein [bacterium]|nr:redoxin domain-containing protein [bacterium]